MTTTQTIFGQPMRDHRRQENDASYQAMESYFSKIPLDTLRGFDEHVFQQMEMHHDHLTVRTVRDLVRQILASRLCDEDQKEEEMSTPTIKQELAPYQYDTQLADSQVGVDEDDEEDEDDDDASVNSAESQDELMSMSELHDAYAINAKNAAGGATNALLEQLKPKEKSKQTASPPDSPSRHLNKDAAAWFPASSVSNVKKPALMTVAEEVELPEEEEIVTPLTPPTSSAQSAPISLPSLSSSALPSLSSLPVTPMSIPPPPAMPSSPGNHSIIDINNSNSSQDMNAFLTQKCMQTLAQHVPDLSTLPPPSNLLANSVPNTALPLAPAASNVLGYVLYPQPHANYLVPVTTATSFASVPNIQLQPNQFPFDYTQFTQSLAASVPVSNNNNSNGTMPMPMATNDDYEYKVSEFQLNDSNSNNNNHSMDQVVDHDALALNAEHINDSNTMSMSMDSNESAYKPSPASPVTPPATRPKEIAPAHNNPSKGNFYISKEKIAEMTHLAVEQFDTDERNDEKLAFGYYKESVGMQINDGQIREHATKWGPIAIINIDLHFKASGKDMFLVATENDAGFKERVRWQIDSFMSDEQIHREYGIATSDLPKSSRFTAAFDEALYAAPINLARQRVNIPDLTKLPKKHSKRDANASLNMPMRKKPQISQYALRRAIQDSFERRDTPTVPVVVIKGKNQWIEWKRFVRITLDGGRRREWIGISLRFHESNRQWKVECIDLDAGRIYYQHRLVGLREGEKYCCSYQKLMQYVTIKSLHIHA